MNMNDFDVFADRVRRMQADNPQGHQALVNWGRWSRDPRVGPREARNGVNQECVTSGDGWAEEVKGSVVEAPMKAEAPLYEPYDEKPARILDERMHGAGGLAEYVRIALKIAYITHAVPEVQFPRHCKCTEQAYIERLEQGLKFARRFV